MEFVNSIANIVHMEVARHDGAANKNIGDAFLLVWKFPPPSKVARSRFGSELSVVAPQPLRLTSMSWFQSLHGRMHLSVHLSALRLCAWLPRGIFLTIDGCFTLQMP